MEAGAAHDGPEGLSRNLAQQTSLGVEDFYAAGFVHAAATKNVFLRVPPRLEGRQPPA